MPSTFGVVSTFGLTTPAGAYTNESSSDASVEVATVENEMNVTVVAQALPSSRERITIKGKGDANLAAVTAGAFVQGTPKIVSAKQTENNRAFPDFEIQAEKFE